jgi:hypothetical protein
VAIEVYQQTVSIPANTLKTALYVSTLALGLWDIESIDLEVPPGPAGLMGFYLAISGQQWIPHSAGEFIVWDDTKDSWNLSGQPTSTSWELHGYNTDQYPHEVVVRFHVNLIPTPVMTTPPSLTIISTPIAQPVSVL